MATYVDKNFSRGKISQLSEIIANGDTFQRCNFAQIVPHTAIAEGYTGLTFIKCNLLNCDVPSGSIIENCLTVHKEFCANRHPDLVTLGYLEAEDADCSHVVDTDEVWIDGELIDIIYYYEDKKVT